MIDMHPPAKAGILAEPYGALPDGRQVTRHTLTNRHGLMLRVLDFGGIITELHMPDRDGVLADIVLGYDSLAQYVADRSYQGALIGRYANRIRNSRFMLDGRCVELPPNDGPHHLHGGPRGYDKVLWTGEPVAAPGRQGLALSYLSPDGEQGYPGKLEVRVLYQLSDDNELIIDYSAATDAPTPVNLTQHTYFNLAGGGDILAHTLEIDAHYFTAIDAEAIPLGMSAPVEATPFDFRAARPIGQCIGEEHEQLRNGRGYDHNFVLAGGTSPGVRRAATLRDPGSGRVLEILTEEPGIQFYSGNFLDGSQGGKGRRHGYRSGLCLEPQHFPDSPNQPGFPSTILRPGGRYTSQTRYVFGAGAG